MRLLAALLLGLFAATSHAAVIWRGDWETGDFMQYVHPTDPTKPYYWGFPQARWPHQPQIGSIGDGTGGVVVTSPARQGNYAVKVTVRNSINGTEPEDCDGSKCNRRRSEANFMGQMLTLLNNGMPYLSERWISISHYVPADWDDAVGAGDYINVMQIKVMPDESKSPTIAIGIKDGYWGVIHRWSEQEYPTSASLLTVPDGKPWTRAFAYTPLYPNAEGDDGGEDLRADFPDQSASQAALADLNKGGWTDWAINVKFDHRSAAEGGTGFLDVYKRKGLGSWLKVLAIVPRTVTRSGVTLERGVCYHGDGYGPVAGMYGPKEQFWGLAANRVLYHDNYKVGDASETLTTMAPEYDDEPLPPAEAPPDVHAPIRGNGAPTATTAGYNKLISWQIADETPPVTCRYRLNAAFAYTDTDDDIVTLPAAGEGTHSATVYLAAGTQRVHVMCQDSMGTPNVNTEDWYWDIVVSEPGEATPGKSKFGKGRLKLR